MTESFESHRPVLAYGDQANRSPWIAQFAEDGPPRPLPRDIATDLVVVGAGIAGIATVFFVLRETACSVVLLERDRVGRGASGRNAGQLTTYFERPLCTIAEEFGAARAAEAQRGFEDAHDLLDLMLMRAGRRCGWSGSPATWGCSTRINSKHTCAACRSESSRAWCSRRV